MDVDDFSRLINEALRRGDAAPKIRVFQGASLAALIKEIGSKIDCDYGPGCPIHGGQTTPEPDVDNSNLLNQDHVDSMMEEMNPESAYRGAIAAIASAHNALVRGDAATAAANQEQARLYFQLRDVCMQREYNQSRFAAQAAAPVEKPAEDAGSRNEDEPVS